MIMDNHLTGIHRAERYHQPCIIFSGTDALIDFYKMERRGDLDIGYLSWWYETLLHNVENTLIGMSLADARHQVLRDIIEACLPHKVLKFKYENFSSSVKDAVHAWVFKSNSESTANGLDVYKISNESNASTFLYMLLGNMNPAKVSKFIEITERIPDLFCPAPSAAMTELGKEIHAEFVAFIRPFVSEVGQGSTLSNANFVERLVHYERELFMVEEQGEEISTGELIARVSDHIMDAWVRCIPNACLLASAIYLIGTDRTVWERLKAELNENFPGKRRLNYERVASMRYLDAVTREILRIASPYLHVFRRFTRNVKDELRGMTYPKDMLAIQMYHDLCLDSNIWDDPKEFKPERFLNPILGIVNAAAVPDNIGTGVMAVNPGPGAGFMTSLSYTLPNSMLRKESSYSKVGGGTLALHKSTSVGNTLPSSRSFKNPVASLEENAVLSEKFDAVKSVSKSTFAPRHLDESESRSSIPNSAIENDEKMTQGTRRSSSGRIVVAFASESTKSPTSNTSSEFSMGRRSKSVTGMGFDTGESLLAKPATPTVVPDALRLSLTSHLGNRHKGLNYAGGGLLSKAYITNDPLAPTRPAEYSNSGKGSPYVSGTKSPFTRESITQLIHADREKRELKLYSGSDSEGSRGFEEEAVSRRDEIAFQVGFEDPLAFVKSCPFGYGERECVVAEAMTMNLKTTILILVRECSEIQILSSRHESEPFCMYRCAARFIGHDLGSQPKANANGHA